MAELTVQTVGRDGLAATFDPAAGGGDSFRNDGKLTWVEVVASVGDVNVTIITQDTVDGLPVDDRVVNVVGGTSKKIGPWPVAIYNDVDGLVQLTYDNVVSVTVAALRLGV